MFSKVACQWLLVAVVATGCSSQNEPATAPSSDVSAVDEPSATSAATAQPCTGDVSDECVEWVADAVVDAAAAGDTVLVAGERDISLLDLETGQPIWTVAAPFPEAHPIGSLGDVATVIGFGDPGQLVGLDHADGHLRWQTDIADLAFGDPEVVVVVTTDGAVERLDPATGEVMWSAVGGDELGFVRITDGIVSYRNGELLRFVDLADGTVRSEVGRPGDLGPFEVVGVADDTAVVFPLTESGSSDALVGLDIDTGERRWHIDVANAQGAFVSRGVAVVATPGGGAAAFDVATGRSRWEFAGGRIQTAFGLDSEAVLVLGEGEVEGIGLIEVADGLFRWRTRADADVRGWSLSDDLLGVARSGSWTIYDAGTGDELVMLRPGPAATFRDPTLVLVGDRLVRLRVP